MRGSNLCYLSLISNNVLYKPTETTELKFGPNKLNQTKLITIIIITTTVILIIIIIIIIIIITMIVIIIIIIIVIIIIAIPNKNIFVISGNKFTCSSPAAALKNKILR